MNSPPDATDAVRALRARGVDTAENLLEHATPTQILAACQRWDTRQGVGPGLLAKWIRNGDYEDEPAPAPTQTRAQRLRATFDEYADQFPEGSVAEPHARLQARRWPDDEPCPGQMIVIEATYPLLSIRCDQCDFEAAIPVRDLHVLTVPTPEAF